MYSLIVNWYTIIHLATIHIVPLTTDHVNMQSDSLTLLTRRSAEHSIELAGINALGSQTPFWLQANQYGTVPRTGSAGLLRIGTAGHLNTNVNHPNRRFTYGVEIIGIAGRQSAVILPQAYLSIKRGGGILWAGRKKEIIGLGDSTLSSGFYSWSGNALPITKVQIGTDGFVPLKFTKGLIAVNTFLAHGWFPNTDSIQGSYLHQKVLFGRIGKPEWKVKLYAGIIHNAQWGGKSKYTYRRAFQNDGQLPSSLNDYLSVVIARQPVQEEGNNVTEHDALNRVGNHVGSIDMGVKVDMKKWTLLAYYQHPFEDKSGLLFANFPDGLYGLSLKRRSYSPVPSFQIDQMLLECLTTMNQSGSQLPFGLDDYFNNFQYLHGWSQAQRVLGTAFITTKPDVRLGTLATTTRNRLFIANNQLQLVHIGVSGNTSSGIRIQAKFSVSQNFGIQRAPFPSPANQLSGIVSAVWPLQWLGGSELKTAVALDQGQLYPNALGGWISLRKTWKTAN